MTVDACAQSGGEFSEGDVTRGFDEGAWLRLPNGSYLPMLLQLDEARLVPALTPWHGPSLRRGQLVRTREELVKGRTSVAPKTVGLVRRIDESDAAVVDFEGTGVPVPTQGLGALAVCVCHGGASYSARRRNRRAVLETEGVRPGGIRGIRHLFLGALSPGLSRWQQEHQALGPPRPARDLGGTQRGAAGALRATKGDADGTVSDGSKG